MGLPVWLLDIDGVINACSKKPDTSVWRTEEWRHGTADGGRRFFPILWAQPVADFIALTHNQGLAEIRWHTTWQQHAKAISELTGLPEFEVALAPEFEDTSLRQRWWKLPAAERVVQEEGRPLVWTDDDIDYSLHNYDIRENLAIHAPVCLVSPNERTGLTPKNLAKIGAFLEAQRAGQ